MNRSLALVLLPLGITVVVAGCLAGAPPDDLNSGGAGPGGGGPGTGTATSGTLGAGGVATSSSTGGPSPNSLAASVDKDLTLSGDIDMPLTSTIAAGATLTLTAGARIHASPGAVLVVAGKLEADGMKGTPVVFQSKDHAGAGGWVGIEVKGGGNASLTQIEIHDATTAFQADPGSLFTIDYILVDTSKKILTLGSDGTLGHGQLHALGAMQGGDPVSVESASPKLSDTLLDNANGGADHINVSGTSSPEFDHMEITNCHCIFHFTDGQNIKVTNSNLHASEYALMVEKSTGTKFTHNNFVKNTTNIGICAGGNATATDNYFEGPPANGACLTSTQEVQIPFGDVGPRP